MHLAVFQYLQMIRGFRLYILLLEPDSCFNGPTFKNFKNIRSRIQNHNQYSVITALAPGANLITANPAPQQLKYCILQERVIRTVGAESLCRNTCISYF
jgi:hypothetical protein